MCSEGGSNPPAGAAGGDPWTVSRAAAAREGARVGGAGTNGGKVGAEAGAGGVVGEVTRRRFCGASGLVLGGDGPTQPGLLGPLLICRVSGQSALRSGVLQLLCGITVFLSVLCALVYEAASRPMSRMNLYEAGGRPW